jgi:hypothetical protein
MPFTTVAGLGLATPDAPAPWARLLASLPRGGGGGAFASLTAAAVGALPRAAGATEPRTKTAFPSEVCHLVKRACPRLTGVG